MKAKEILEVLSDMASVEIVAGFPNPSHDKWEKRLDEAVYSEVSSCLKYMGDIGRLDSLSSFVIACYDKELIELVLKLVNTRYEHLIMDAVKGFAREEKK